MLLNPHTTKHLEWQDHLLSALRNYFPTDEQTADLYALLADTYMPDKKYNFQRELQCISDCLWDNADRWTQR